MYLLARAIKARGFKVVMSGEGADEVFGGYLYFHKAPSAAEFHAETVRKVTRLHQWDVLRANKAPFAWGLEPRVPFLDRGFLDVCMSIDPAAKMVRDTGGVGGGRRGRRGGLECVSAVPPAPANPTPPPPPHTPQDRHERQAGRRAPAHGKVHPAQSV